MIGAGWIVPFHLAALERLGRTKVVGITSGTHARAAAIARPLGAVASDDPLALVDELRPDAVYLCVPPFRAVGLGEALVERGIPFLTEKPLAATDAAGPVRLAAAIEGSGLVVAVGYHLRGIEALATVQERLDANPAQLVAGRWIGSTPGPAWWRRVDEGGGQVVEQATHLFDLSRHLVGEAEVTAASSLRESPPVPTDTDVADATAAILQFETGALGSFVTARRASDATVDLSLISDGARTTIRRAADAPGGWEIELVDGDATRTIPAGRDPYEVQAERFLDAVVAGDPSRVLSSYGDALRTDRLTRAVVSATGQPG